CASVPPGSSCAAGGPHQEQQPELADLHLVARVERDLLDALAVHIRAVEAAHVAHRELAAAVAVELDVTARDRDVVEEDVALGMAAGGGQVLVEPVAAALVGPPGDGE